jgi:hypothetical protein
MKRFYYVTFTLMILGLLILCVYAPWTQPEPNSPNQHQTIGYAPVWSNAYAQIPNAHVDWSGAFAAIRGRLFSFRLFLAGSRISSGKSGESQPLTE